jgi:Fungal Zn(2)-Cys(6) binuclear cluster domain
MKIIRVGSATTSRIAQACDRCRSKKIRCDGIRPTCTQCANVGFECKTSDKLSRRAFPRGYTESLEDRVRGLEAECRELKQLLDEKDEKIDMLSRLHSFSSPSRKGSSSLSPGNAAQIKEEMLSPKEDYLHVEIPAPVQSEAPSTGTSTTSAFVESFDEKIQEHDKRPASLSSVSLVSVAPTSRSTTTTASKTPPRILSDQYISK